MQERWAGGGAEKGDIAHAAFSEKQRGWERQVRSGVAVAGAGGLWEPLAVRTEVGRAGWGTPSIRYFPAGFKVSHTLAGMLGTHT